MELLITRFTSWLICLDHWNPLVHWLFARRPFKKSVRFGIPHFLLNISTSIVKKCFNQDITTEQLVANALHPSCKGSKCSPDELIVVTDSVTLRNIFLVKTHFFPRKGTKYLSSGKKPNPVTMVNGLVKGFQALITPPPKKMHGLFWHLLKSWISENSQLLCKVSSSI